MHNIAVRNLSLTDAEEFVNSDIQSFVSVGIHPWDLENLDQFWIERLMKIAEDNRVVMIGECGLDKNIETTPERQIEVFSEQIKLSELFQKPLIIHCAGRFNKLIELKKMFNPSQKWIVHGFRGKPQLAGQLLKAGIDLSFGEKFNPESIQITPIERLFIETDESAMPIERIYEQIARIRGCKINDLNAGNVLLRM